MGKKWWTSWSTSTEEHPDIAKFHFAIISKSEARSPKQARMFKFAKRSKQMRIVRDFENLNFGFVSKFDIRISYLLSSKGGWGGNEWSQQSG
jgi:hypothetical protein